MKKILAVLATIVLMSGLVTAQTMCPFINDSPSEMTVSGGTTENTFAIQGMGMFGARESALSYTNTETQAGYISKTSDMLGKGTVQYADQTAIQPGIESTSVMSGSGKFSGSNSIAYDYITTGNYSSCNIALSEIDFVLLDGMIGIENSAVSPIMVQQSIGAQRFAGSFNTHSASAIIYGNTTNMPGNTTYISGSSYSYSAFGMGNNLNFTKTFVFKPVSIAE